MHMELPKKHHPEMQKGKSFEPKIHFEPFMLGGVEGTGKVGVKHAVSNMFLKSSPRPFPSIFLENACIQMGFEKRLH